MTDHGGPRVWLEQFPLGEPQPFELDYHCLRYSGEIIRSDSWDPEWGEPLTGDRYFRIVLLLQQSTASTPIISDSALPCACRAPKHPNSGAGCWMSLLPSEGLRPCI